MRIDRSNYEAILIDFLDGNLSPKEIDSLMVFLSNNSDIEEELARIYQMRENAETVELEEKSEILEEDGSYFEELCIGSVENDLSKEERATLNSMMANNPILQAKYDSYQKIKFPADNSIIFEQKEDFIRPEPFLTRKRLFYFSSIFIAISVFFWFLFQNSNSRFRKTTSEFEYQQEHFKKPIKKTRITPIEINEKNEEVKTETISEKIESLEEKQDILVKPVSNLKTDPEVLEKSNTEIPVNNIQITLSSESKHTDIKGVQKEQVAKDVSEHDTNKLKEPETLLLSSDVLIVNTELNQNLIPNASFEKPIDFFYSDKDTSWHKYNKDDTPDYFNFSNDHRMNDIFDTYLGGIKPKDGLAYMGIFCYRTSEERRFENVREYIRTPLLKTLDKDSVYKFEISLCLDEESNIAIKNFSVYFTSKSDKINNYKLFNSSPQIKFDSVFLDSSRSWITLSCDYIAKGNENYIILGNFNSDKETQIKKLEHSSKLDRKEKWKLVRDEKAAYYFIDNLSLKKVE